MGARLVMKNKFLYPSLETERMHLKILTLLDAEEAFQHFSDEQVTKYMDIEPCKDLEEAKEIIQFHLDDSGCRWGLFHKEDQAFMGTGGFHCLETKNELKAEIGFDLAKAYWGRGYMTEAIQAMIQFGFNEMKLDYIEATVEPGNTKSIKFMQKLGFIQDIDLKGNLIYFCLKKDK
jgi:[ribosomal protein S5]-alanine N-acetyltransferase